MAVSGIPTDFLFLCKVISPWTTEQESQQLREAIRYRELDWDAVVAYANRSNLAPALAHGLAARGLWKITPARLRDYLADIYRFNGQRNVALLEQLREIIGLLNEAGISPLLLKGSAALAMHLFSDPAIRFMWDLDLLVPDSMMRQAVSALKGTGYFVPEKHKNCLSEAPDSEVKPESRHYAPMNRAGAMADVELHYRLLPDRCASLLDMDAVWRESWRPKDNQLAGLSFVLLSPTHQLIYCFAHSEIAHRNHYRHSLDLRQLYDFAHLCSRWKNELDWTSLATLRKDIHFGRILGAYYYLAEQLFGVNNILSSGSDAYARRHFSKVTWFIDGKWEWLRPAWEILNMAKLSFSAERLQALYPQRGHASVNGLRLYRLGSLIRKYGRLGPWKALVGSCAVKYDSKSLFYTETSFSPVTDTKWHPANDGDQWPPGG
jgi:hypothetical protein